MVLLFKTISDQIIMKFVNIFIAINADKLRIKLRININQSFKRLDFLIEWYGDLNEIRWK